MTDIVVLDEVLNALDKIPRKLCTKEFLANGTFIPSARLLALGGVVRVRLRGGGGAGGQSTQSGGGGAGGGGSGEYIDRLTIVTGNTSVVIGLGGSKGSLTGSNGGDTSFGALVAKGGKGGSYGNINSPYGGGAGGAGGNPGQPGQSGAGGACGCGGTGELMGSTPGSGQDAAPNSGAGGAGGYYTTTATTLSTGGGSGIAIIEWWE